MNINNKKGLSLEEVIKSRNKYGSNKLTVKKKHTIFSMIIESLNDPIIKILLIALCVKILFLFKDSNIYETLGIAIAVFLASFISVLSEYGSEKAFERLSEENSSYKVKVIRDSKKCVIPVDEVVVGDVVYLESGDKVPSDGVIIEGSIYIDESALTGETFEKLKKINDEVYMGSIVTNQSGVMKATKVGNSTYYGKIASDIQEKTIESPLKSKLRDLAKYISYIGYFGAILVFVSYMLNVILSGETNLVPHIIYALTLSVAVIVMAVPEGLPMMITLVLSSNMKRLLKKNVLVRKLVGIETSGSLNILFTDKTGTLTEGKLKVENFIDAELNSHKKINNLKDEVYETVYQSLVYNNESFYSDGVVQGGNTTDRAILEYCGSDNKNKYKYKIISKELFNSKLKYSKVITNYNGKTEFIKGAYEVILDKCTYYMKSNGEKRVLIDKNKILNYINNITNNGNRVLGLAINDGIRYILIGFVTLKDTIRKEAFSAIESIKSAGVLVVMVTGDAKETACSIAKELKIIDNEKDIVLTSEEFNNMAISDIEKILPRLKVLCRSLPEDKNKLVKIAQENNLIVGMTGDGVNDSPALKRADVGFSMGSGTEVAKEASDVVILDNNILSISYAILYGRTIFKNIRKFVVFQLSVNICAVLVSIISPFIGVLAPITVIQVLWVNMVMDTFAGLAFSFEPALKEYMLEAPKKRNEKIINSYMKNQIFFNGIYSTIICIWFLTSPLIKQIYIDDKYLMTAFFGLFIFIDIFNAFTARTSRVNTFSNLFKNKIFLLIFLFITIVQIMLIYFGGELFRTTGLTFYEFEIMILIAFSIIVFDIFRKVLIKKKTKIDMKF